ncbi:hypothetical protein DEJ50_20930 [Streptomyces venezuelae]|uniref:Uncharacterized protein n=1 Tax=Streptomyces venezuelae TaxID=54571 RepID=A0A5P2D9H5_STRVZ|nr:hypothetical protein [Streptomyces venezuelae]QES49921.1 hypothetical protein DEJ50_20930 [Streptomyces venezuelae]
MITDPELDAAWEQERAPEAPDVVEPAAPRERRRYPGWLWALGGVLAASTVWAGGLYAYGDELAAPDVAYEAPEKLCDRFKASALTAAVPGLQTGQAARESNAALDWAVCVLAVRGVETGAGDRIRYHGAAEIEVHRKVDPGVEFGLGGPGWRFAGWEAATVSGLGERAVMYTDQAGRMPALQVVDGGAVLTLWLSGADRVDKNGVPTGEVVTDTLDYEAVKYALIEDMRKLMAAARKD